MRIIKQIVYLRNWYSYLNPIDYDTLIAEIDIIRG